MSVPVAGEDPDEQAARTITGRTESNSFEMRMKPRGERVIQYRGRNNA